MWAGKFSEQPIEIKGGAANQGPRVRPMGAGGAALANERWRVRFESEAGRRAEGPERRAEPGQVMAALGGLGGPGRDSGVLEVLWGVTGDLGSPAMCSVTGHGVRSRWAE